MEYIFISHSQYDKTLRDFFARTIKTNAGLKPVLMEYENLTHQNAGKLIKRIIMSNDCKCLIVLIGKRILFPEGYNYSFTHNWVGFEVGVAPSKGMPIIVFEGDFLDFKDIVDFPIPYLDHYVRYKQDASNSKYIGKMLKVLKDNIPFQKEMFSEHIKCSWTHCNADYFYWNIRGRSIQERIPCPVCRGLFRPGVDKNLIRGDESGHMPAGVV